MGATDPTLCGCLGCLSHKDGMVTHSYIFKNEALKTVFQVDNLNLCFICKSIVQRFERFVHTVQRNQIYLETCNEVPLVSETIQYDFKPLINLTSVSVFNIELTGDSEDVEKPISEVYTAHTDIAEIKLELKQELEQELEQFDTDYDDNEYQDASIIGEEYFPDIIKEENKQILDNIALKQHRKTLKKNKPQKKLNKSKKNTKHVYQEKEVKGRMDPAIKMLHVSKEQVIKERMKLREDPIYKNLMYKCEDCIKGFNLKESYEKHMEVHSQVMGKYICDICKRRTDSMEKLITHKKYHRIRYKCSECGLTRVCRRTVRNHYVAEHLHVSFQHKCSHCNKTFDRQFSLNRHLAYVHKSMVRIKCKIENCKKTFANKESMKGHLLRLHKSELRESPLTRHVCQECGASFQYNSQLKSHMLKHSTSREFYCVECDKGFKTKYALTQHLKIAAPHVNYLELKLQCEYCNKRFGIRRALEHHLNRIHLNRKPYQCDICDKAYINEWSLTEHKRFKHEGHKRALKYPCPFCDKKFAQNSTLKSHILTHTGEKPYKCTQCPAQFSQSNILRTHIKLVHLQLTRDGRPKKQ